MSGAARAPHWVDQRASTLRREADNDLWPYSWIWRIFNFCQVAKMSKDVSPQPLPACRHVRVWVLGCACMCPAKDDLRVGRDPWDSPHICLPACMLACVRACVRVDGLPQCLQWKGFSLFRVPNKLKLCNIVYNGWAFLLCGCVVCVHAKVSRNTENIIKNWTSTWSLCWRSSVRMTLLTWLIYATPWQALYVNIQVKTNHKTIGTMSDKLHVGAVLLW